MNSFARIPGRMAMYVCRGCGYECADRSRFVKCPVCGIKWG